MGTFPTQVFKVAFGVSRIHYYIKLCVHVDRLLLLLSFLLVYVWIAIIQCRYLHHCCSCYILWVSPYVQTFNSSLFFFKVNSWGQEKICKNIHDAQKTKKTLVLEVWHINYWTDHKLSSYELKTFFVVMYYWYGLSEEPITT